MRPSKVQKLWFASWKQMSLFFPRCIAKKAEDLFLTPIRYQRPENENDVYASAKITKILNGLQVYQWGISQNPLVLLVHGWNGRGTQLGYFVDDLLAKGFCVIALDGPAHGESEGLRTHVGEFSQALIDVQKYFGTLQGVIAHSFGGGCSVFAASKGMDVRKIVLIGSPAHYDRVVNSFLSRMRLSTRAKNIFIESLTRQVGVKPDDLNIGILGNQLKNVKGLIVHDELDKEVPITAAHAMHEKWQGSEVFITRGLGHKRILRDKDVSLKISEFMMS